MRGSARAVVAAPYLEDDLLLDALGARLGGPGLIGGLGGVERVLEAAEERNAQEQRGAVVVGGGGARIDEVVASGVGGEHQLRPAAPAHRLGVGLRLRPLGAR